MDSTIEHRLGRTTAKRALIDDQAQQERPTNHLDTNLEASFLLSDLRDEPVDPSLRLLPDWIQAELLRFEMGVEAAQRAGVWRYDRNPPVLSHFAYTLTQLLDWARARPGHPSRTAVELPDATEWETFDWASGAFADEWKIRFPPNTEDKQRYVAWRATRDAPAKPEPSTKKRR